MVKLCKTLLACLACLFVGGCLITTDSAMKKTWAQWEGRDVTLFFNQFGQPHSPKENEQGGISYKWVGVGDATTIFGASYGHGVSLYCILTIEVLDGKISSMRMAKTEGEWNWPRCNQILNGK